MHLPRAIQQAPRGSALVTTMFVALIMGLATMSLITFGMEKRRETARLVIYNEELAAAERALDRFISQVYFVSINRVPQVGGLNTGGYAGFIQLGTGNVADSRFNVGIVTQPVRQNLRTIIDDAIIRDIPEVAQWRDYTIILDSYRVIAGAMAYRDSGLAMAGTMTNRPGVYVSTSVSYYQVPLLNYAIFYEPTLELDAGVRIDTYGKVHTNSDWFLTSSSEAWYHDFCTVAGNFYGGIYNPLDGERRNWWSGSNNINLPFRGPGSVGAAAFQHNRLHQASIGVNRGYLSAAIYNPSNPATGNPSVNFGYVDAATGLWGAQSPADWWQPNPDWVDMAYDMYGNHLRDQSMGVQKIKMPIGEGSDPSLVIQPPLPEGRGSLPADDRVTREAKLAYQAAIILEVTGPGWVLGGNNLLNNVAAYRLIPDSSEASGYRKEYFSLTYRLAGASPTSTPRSFISHTVIYNGREEKDVHLLDIDMGRLAEYLNSTSTNADATRPKFSLQNADPAAPSGIIYVHIPQSVELHGANYMPAQSSTTIPGRPSNIGTQGAVRIRNAQDLSPVLSNSGIHPSNGLSIVTSAPLYTRGHVNSPSNAQARIPLLLASDAINTLSVNFTDSAYDPRTDPTSSNFTGDGPKAQANNTNTNAVFFTGNVPTKYRQYGGGAENFYRYIETWGGKTHYYRGSMLNMFHSKIATRSWDKNTGTATASGYYSAPRRDWGWDANFAAGNEPPGMPSTFQYAIGRWELTNEQEYLSFPNAVRLTLRNKPT